MNPKAAPPSTSSKSAKARQPRARKGAPGLLDVAARAQVSGATVSRSFTRPKTVKPQTRQRVMQAAAELGYIRDRMASGLHSRRSGTVGCIVPTIDNAIFSELIEAFAQRLGEQERTMLIASHDYDVQREVGIVRSLLERRIDGLALIGREHDPVALEMLKLRDIPVVALWCTSGPTSIPVIGTDNRRAGYRITKHLLELGHRDIALLVPDTKHNDRAADRLDGIREALGEQGLTLPQQRLLTCPYDSLEAKQVALTLLQSVTPPSAIIGCNDVIAHGVLHAARKLRIDVPENLSVVGIGDFKGSAAMEPELTTMRLPARRIGRLAADHLCRPHTTRNVLPADNIIESELILRNSTARPI
jgi:LacI family transcriptional regulator